MGPLMNSGKQGYPTSARWVEALWNKDLSIVEPSKRAEALLTEPYGSGFIGLEDSVRGNAQDLAKES